MPKGISLHIGLNSVNPAHYQGWVGKLQACEADAKSMASICKSKGFTTDILFTKDATRANVINKLQAYANQLKLGDIFVLSYSGHGGQVPDRNAEEIDKKDETWCFFDGQLIDDELEILLSKFKSGVRVLVFSDSCHSGTVIKSIYNRNDASEYETRNMPIDIEQIVYLENKEFYDTLLKDSDTKAVSSQASIILISGCQDNQVSADGRYNGLFTSTLLTVWNKGRYFGDYKRFHREIVNRMPPRQTPNIMLSGNHTFGFINQPIFTI